MDIGNKILFLRKNKGVTQEQLAQTLGVSNQAVSKWESGQCFPDIQLLPDIARYFNVSSDELLGIETQSSNDDILITINDVIQNSKPGTEMAQIMKILFLKYGPPRAVLILPHLRLAGLQTYYVIFRLLY